MKKNILKTDPRQAIVVLGMHRSGTSAMAGTLGQLGCDMPQHPMPPNENNPSGYFESLAIYQLNDAILASAGTSWDDWQAFNPDWLTSPRAQEFLLRATEVLAEEFGASRFFLVKDPRMCQLLPFWLGAFEAAGIAPRIVLMHRNPIEVAASLERREAWPFAYGLLLWLRHVLDAEANSRGLPRFCTSYDLLLDNWATTATQMKEALKISFPRWSAAAAADVDAFLDGKLRHQHGKAASVIKDPFVSIWVRDTLEVLERWAETGEDAEDYDRLDRIRAEFNTAAPLFLKLVHTARNTTAERDAARVKAEALSAEIASQQAALETVRTEAQAEVKTLNDHITYRDAALAAQHDKTQAEIAALNAEVAKNHATLEAAQAETSQLAVERGAVETRAEQLDQNLRTALSRIEELDAEVAKNHAALEAAQAETSQLTAERGAVETRAEQLDQNLCTALSRIEELDAQITDLRHDRDHLDSALRQRSAEVEDVSRENAENAAKVTQLSQRLETLTAEYERTGRESRMLRVRLEEQNRRDLTDGLARNRASHDARLAKVQATAEAAATERDDLRTKTQAEITALNAQLETTLAEHQAQVQTLTQETQALLQSTSWRLTAPLRALLMVFRK
jgi:hypothetical protein